MKHIPFDSIALILSWGDYTTFADNEKKSFQTYKNECTKKEYVKKLKNLFAEQGETYWTNYVLNLKSQYELLVLLKRKKIYDFSISATAFVDILSALIETKEGNENWPVFFLQKYIQKVLYLEGVEENLVDLDTYLKSLANSTKEDDKKRMRAIHHFYGDAKKYNKLKYRQLLQIYDVNTFCAKALIHLLGTLNRSFENIDGKEEDYHYYPLPWNKTLYNSQEHDKEFGPMEFYLKAKFGDKLGKMVGIPTKQISWWHDPLQDKNVWLYNPELCPQLDVAMKITTEELKSDTSGFFNRMSEAQQIQWELLKAVQPDIVNHDAMKTVNQKKNNESHHTMGPWLTLWETTFGLQLMDCILFHHEIYTQPITLDETSSTPKTFAVTKSQAPGGKIRKSKGRQRKPLSSPLVVPGNLAAKRQSLQTFADMTKVLKYYHHCHDAPRVFPFTNNLGYFLLDLDIIPHLPFTTKLLEQWLCAALSCVLTFECSTLEFRHLSLEESAAKCMTSLMTLTSRTKQRLILGMYILARQVFEYPNSDKQGKYPAIILDQVILPCLPVLQWLCCGYASYFMNIVNYLQNTSTSDSVFTPMEAHMINPELEDFFTRHYWNYLFWLRGKEELSSPLNNKELDLEALVKDTSSPLLISPPVTASFAIKPFSTQEKTAYDCLVVEDLKNKSPDAIKILLFESAKCVVLLAHKHTFIDTSAFNSIDKVLHGKKAKKFMQELSKDLRYAPAKDSQESLKQLFMFSVLYNKLASTVPGTNECDSALSLIVRLGGELLLKEQLVRVVSVCSAITGSQSNKRQDYEPLLDSEMFIREKQPISVHAGCLSYSVVTSDKRFLGYLSNYMTMVIHDGTAANRSATDLELRQNIKKGDLKDMFRELMSELQIIEYNITLVTRDWMWAQFVHENKLMVQKLTSQQELDTQNYIIHTFIPVMFEKLGNIIIDIAKENFTNWENGREAFPKRFELMYFVRSLFTILLHERYNFKSYDSLQEVNTCYDQDEKSLHVVDDDVSTEIYEDPDTRDVKDDQGQEADANEKPCCHGKTTKKGTKSRICQDCEKKKHKTKVKIAKNKKEELKKSRIDEEVVVTTSKNESQRVLNLAEFVHNLIESYENEYLQWKQGNPMRTQGAEQILYDVESVKKYFDNKRMQSDILITQHCMTDCLNRLEACAINEKVLPLFQDLQTILMKWGTEKDTINLSNYPIMKSLVFNPQTNPVLSITSRLTSVANFVFHINTDMLRQLSPIYYASALLADFELFIALAYSNAGRKDDAPVNIPNLMKFMGVWRKNLMNVAAVATQLVPGEDVLNHEELMKFIDRSQTCLVLDWKSVCVLRKSLDTLNVNVMYPVEMVSCVEMFHNFKDKKLADIALALHLPSGKNITEDITQKAAKGNSIWCRNCSDGPKKKSKNKIETFISCKTCKDRKIENIHYFCSEECKDAWWKQEHAADHLGDDLGLLKI